MELFEVLKERSSYRGEYLPAKVDRGDLEKIMRAGLDAPSGCNMQTTSLIALDDPALVKELGGMLGKRGFASAPAAICVLTEEIPALGGRLYNVQDYAAAIENMLLAITALGYASCWVEGYVTGAEGVGLKMAKALGVPENVRVVAYLPVGTPASAPRRAPKKEFSQRAWFNGYGA